MLAGMAHEFESPLVEEFYNKCHSPSTGKFCSGKAVARDNRVRGQQARRKNERTLKANAKRAATREANKKKVNPNKDGSEALVGKYKTTGDKNKDLINLTRLDRGSPERKAASKLWNARYGKG